ncbi:MAG: ActS/PrrB/RegB family redox-sensitive histidine kinase [Devosiaceae bacterium]|nr:ActS/PrrB/RegB family redox-sensitive histidine kinase [Devosiaceae bacterium]
MPDSIPFLPSAGAQGRPLLLGTLVRLRWIALAGQIIGILFVALILKFPFPHNYALLLIAVSVFFNIALVVRFGDSHRPATALVATQLAFDSLQLAGLLWLTGGLQNPFSLLLLAPVSVSATILPQRETALVGALAVIIVTVLSRSHLPLPWDPALNIELPPLYTTGVWVALICGIVFVTVYANRVAHEGRQLADALTATELALSRQHHLSALDGLAAAAAHELGTPLSTISLAAKEMMNEVKEGPVAQDARLIVEQAARCRAILSGLRNLDSQSNSPFAEVTVSELLAELIRPLAPLEKTIKIDLQGDKSDEPRILRQAGLLHGLGNLIENAAQFANKNVCIIAKWDSEKLSIFIQDDGPGFPLDLLPRMGQPYLKTNVPEKSDARGAETVSLGLGVFIATTLLSRTRASINFTNIHNDGHAQVQVVWPRDALTIHLA